MDDNEYEYHTGRTKLKHIDYVRNNRTIVVLWGIFVIVFLILNVVVFSQPQWIGDTDDSPVPGFLGLWEYCVESIPGQGFVCNGDFLKMSSFLNDAFKACTMMVGLSALLFFISIGCFVLFCVMHTGTVLRICACMQLLAGILMAVACAIYPLGWDSSEIKSICGVGVGQYDIGICRIRWGYVLAIALVFDAFILSILAFVLAACQAESLPAIYKDDDKVPIAD